MKHQTSTRADRKSWIVPVLVVSLVWATPGPSAIAFAQRPATENATETDLVRSLDALQASLADLPRDSFEPEAVLLDVGLDPLDLYAWVRDGTVLVPYRGLLRGPRGVLMDRVGNSLDRALLLHELLVAAGDDVRLARARLDEDTARRILGEAAGLSVTPSTFVARAPDVLAGYAAAYGLDAAPLLDEATRIGALHASLREELGRRVALQRGLLEEALAAAAPAVGHEEAEAIVAAGVDAARDHWWVQRRENGVWIDMDPVASDAGRALAAAESTVPLDGWASFARSEPSLAHAVAVRVVAECWRDGALERTDVLDSGPLLAAEALDEPITLQHVPIGWPARGALAGDEPAAVLDAAADVTAWVPMLHVGERTLTDLAFSEDCAFEPSDEVAIPGAVVADTVGGVTDLFGSLPGGETESDPAAARDDASHLSAVWLEYELSAPGSSARTVRRVSFDRVGPAARAGDDAPPVPAGDDWPLALLGRSEVLIQAHGLTPAYAEHVLGTALEANRGALVGLTRALAEGDSDGGVGDRDVGELTGLPPSHLHALALLRDQGPASRLYIGSANVLTFHSRPSIESGTLRLVQSFDIVANDVEVRPLVGLDARRARLEQGLRDTNAEALLAALPCDADPELPRSCQATPNAADRLASEPDGWIAIASLDDARLADLATLPAGLEEALDAGSLVLLATQGDPVWWEIDPETGSALGRDAMGWGNASVDYAIGLGLNVLAFAVCMATSTSRLGNASCVAGAFLGWGAGIAVVAEAVVAARVIAIAAGILAALPAVVEIHSR